MTKAEEKAALFVEKVTAHREAKVITRTVAWLERNHWSCLAHPGNERGHDIEATKDGERWIIEAKCCVMNPVGDANNFPYLLGDVLMKRDAAPKFSIALPDLPVFRGCWSRLRLSSKRALNITCLFVPVEGDPAVLSE